MSNTATKTIDGSVRMRGWPLWRVLLVGVLAYGLPTVFLAIFSALPPAFAPGYVAPIALVFAVLGIASLIWNWKTNNWLARLGIGLTFCGLFFTLAVRSWFAVLVGPWLWLVVGVTSALLVLAWALPAIAGSLSAWILREQSSPQSGVGRAIMMWALVIGGAAGTLGAGLGMSLSRTGHENTAYFIVAVGMSGVSISLAQSTSHQLWPDRPWASRKRSPDKA